MCAYRTWEVVRPTDQWRFTFTVPERYANLEFVHAGVQGVIASAHDTELQQKVAIKKVLCSMSDGNSGRRVYEDLAMLATMRHPNLLRFISAFAPDSQLSEVYLVMEWQPYTIHQISIKKRLKHSALSFLIYRCLSGVRYLHRMGIVYGDLKPSNIVVDEQYQVQLLDPGLSRLIWDQESRLSEFTTQRRYRAPEILMGAVFDGKADVWSIGCIFAQLVLGNPLFPPAHPLDLWKTVLASLGDPSHISLDQAHGSLTFLITKFFLVKNSPFGSDAIKIRRKRMEELFPDELFEKESEVPDQGVTATAARQMISRMLAVNPNDRYSVDEALNDQYVRPWQGNSEIDLCTVLVLTPQAVSRSLQEWKVYLALFCTPKSVQNGPQKTGTESLEMYLQMDTSARIPREEGVQSQLRKT